MKELWGYVVGFALIASSILGLWTNHKLDECRKALQTIKENNHDQN